MKISCTACGAKYTIADDKVRGRKVKVRCKSCNNPIVVDTAQQPAADANQFNDATEVKNTAATFGFNESPAAGNGRGVVWSVNLSDTDQRNLTANEIVEGWRAGWVTDDAYVWKDGMGDWTPILEVAELRALLGTSAQPAAAAIPAAAAPVSTATPAATSIPRPASTGPKPEAAAAAAIAAASSGARLAERRQQVAADLFGGAAAAGSEDEVIHTSAPAVPGSTPYHEAKPSGARNENSVLFSLDALKAGFAPTAPQNKPKPEPVHRGTGYSQPDDPFGMSSGNSGVARLGGGGGVNPLFGADDRALLFAPPPPEPKRPVLAAFTGSSAATAEPVAAGEYALMAPPRRGPNKMVLIGGAVALIAVIVILAFALSGKKSNEVSAAEANKNDMAQKANEKKADEKKAETKDEKTETAAAAPSASATTEKKAVAPQPKKKTEDKEAASSSETEKKTATSAAAETGSSGEGFNKGAAVSALTSAASAATSCKRPGGPTGTGKVTVTFAPNGHITNASVSGGDFEGSSVGGCVASVFRRAHIPAFSGSAVTVSKSFTISP